MTPAPPFPGPGTAVWLTVGSWLLTALVIGIFAEPLGPVAALGIGLVTGLGVTGTLAAQRVPPPQAERIGLRGFAPRLVLALALLVPLVLLVSELDNVVRALVPGAGAAMTPDATATAEEPFKGLFAIEAAIVLVGLAPVIEEFFFRGVLQQGLIAFGGARRGILGAAGLYALGHGNLVTTPAGWVSATLGSLAIGATLGYARLASRSLLAPIALSMAISGVGVLSAQLAEALPIPGFNAPGDHTPLAWLGPAAVSVVAGVVLLARERPGRASEPAPDEQGSMAP